MSDASSNKDSIKNTPLRNNHFTPLALSAQGCVVDRNYISSKEITDVAVDHYRTKKGTGITWKYLTEIGLAKNKQQAQDTLKYHLRKGILFTLEDKRPQQYYPTAVKSDIMESLQKNTPLDPIGVAFPNQRDISKGPLANCMEPAILQTLEGYILPLLPKAPLFIHNMHFKTKVCPECYSELKLPHYTGNRGKHHTEIIGNTHVDYIHYSSGTVNIITTCSKNPHKLETEEDRSRLIAFFGQIRDRLIILLADKHERLVPDILEWQITECDINKDIEVSNFFHFSATKVQVRHLDHLFSIYIKSMGKDTVCRIEERKHPAKKPAVEFINDTFNPYEQIEKHLRKIESKIDAGINKFCANNDTGLYDISSQNGKGDKSN